MSVKDVAKLIDIYLELDRKPVGVKFFYDKESFDNFEVDQRDRKVTYCNAVQLATKGSSMKLTKENQACPNGAFALNFTDVPEPIANGMGRLKKGIYDNQEISKSINDEMEFNKERPYGVAVMPLEKYDVNPDVVIIVGGSYEIMRVIQGYGHHYGYPQNLKTVGLQAVCHDLTTYPLNHNDINITLLCPGTRLVADWIENELGVGIAWDKVEKTVDGIKMTTNPFSRDKAKKEIIKKLEAEGMDTSTVTLSQNYDTGSYKGGKIEI